MERLLTVRDVAERTRYSRSFVYELMSRGTLPSVSQGRTRRVREADLDDFIRRLVEPAQVAAA